MTYYVEIRPAVRRAGAPNLVPLDQVHNFTGFRSIVAYDEDTANMIREMGSTANLRGLPVYADTLFIDFDGHDPKEFREWLQGSGLGFTEWNSGNRSVHHHIPLEPIFGAWVTVAMKQWIRQHAPTADISFYHNGGQYRLPGTYHAKRPGQRKTLVAEQSGDRLVLQQPKETPLMFRLTETVSKEDFYAMLAVAKGEGHRQPYAWLLSLKAAEAGFTFDEALEHVVWWAETLCSPPHPEHVIRQQCEKAYRSVARRQA